MTREHAEGSASCPVFERLEARILLDALSDLTIIELTAPAIVEMSQPLSVSWTTKNEGSADAVGWWSDTVYYSADSTLDAADVPLGEFGAWGHTPLSPGATYPGLLNATAPGGLPIGPGFLLAVTDSYSSIDEAEEGNNVYAQAITVTSPDVDLQITAASAPTEARLGESIDVSWTVFNVGGEAAQSIWSDSVYLSEDDVLDPSDSLMDMFSAGDYSPLAGGSSYVQNAQVYVSSHASAETSYLLFVVDHNPWAGGEGGGMANAQGETDETNNVFARTITLTAPDVDLAITAVTAPTSASPGEQINLSWTVQNIGGEPTTANVWYDRVLLSDDDVLDAADRSIRSVTVNGPLAADGTYSMTDVLVTIPSNMTVGDMFLIVVADGFDYQVETADANNVHVQPFRVDGPDLIIVGVAPASAGIDESITVEWTVTNVGTGPSTASRYDRVYLSSDEILDGEDTSLGRTYRSVVLAPGAEDIVVRMLTLPDTSPVGGTNYLLFVTDIDDQVTELAEDNNVSVVAIEISGPDLAITTASVVPSTADLGDYVSVSMEVTNQGGVAATASYWYDAVYISADDVWDGSDDWLFQQSASSNSPLAPGGSYVVARDVKIPDDTPPGAQYILFLVDSTYKQDEAGENNNVLAFPIDLAGPDLTVTSFTAPPEAILNETLDLTWGVANQGTSEARAYWYDAVYVSVDDIFDDGDIRAGITSPSAHRPLPGGGNYTLDYAVEIPNVGEGDFFLLLVTDSNESQGELREDNNILASAITLSAPDLALATADAPASGIVNGTIDVSWTVTNIGAVAAPADWYDSVYLSTDEIVDPDDARLGRVSQAGQSPLDAGLSYTTEATFSVPNVGTGDFHLLFCTDRESYWDPASYDNNQQGETNEDNNEFSLPIHIDAPDLQVTAADAPSWASLNDTVEVSYTVTNTGVVAAPRIWYDEIYISDFDNPAQAKTYVARRYIDDQSPLGSGQSYDVTLDITLPDVGTGPKYLLFITDTYNHQGESDETNNYLAVAIDLVSPDLVVSAASVAVGAASLGETVDVSYTVTNQGVSTAPADWFDYVYLSTDATLDAGDDRLEAINVADLTPVVAGGSYQVDRSVTLSDTIAGFAPGVYYLLFSTDGNEHQGESNEDNNVRAVVLTLMAPDLQVADLTVESGVLMSGAEVTVRWNDANTGEGSAQGWFADRIEVTNLTTAQALLTFTLYHNPADGSVPAGGALAREYTFSLSDDNASVGELAFTVTTDCNSEMQEYDAVVDAETNNSAALVRTSTLATYPDLQVTDLTVETAGAMHSGGEVTVRWRDVNTGNTSADGWWYDQVSVWNTTTGQSAFTRGVRYDENHAGSGPIEPGQSRPRVYSFSLPDGLIGAGELEFSVTADHTDRVTEADMD